MSQARLAWAAFKNMMRQAARDPLWAFVALLAAPFRIWKPLLGVLFILVMALFVIGFGGRFALEQIGIRAGSVPILLLDLVTLLVVAALAFRFLTNPLIIHFGDMEGETHGSARFATDKEMAPLARADTGLLNRLCSPSAVAWASSIDASGTSKANSSPPMRPKQSSRRSAALPSIPKRFNTRSPASWPWWSFTLLKPSRSR